MNEPRKDLEKAKLFECICHSPEHQLVFKYDAKYKDLDAQIYIYPFESICTRVVKAFKYVFGWRRWQGDFDTFHVNPDDIDTLIVLLQEYKADLAKPGLDDETPGS